MTIFNTIQFSAFGGTSKVTQPAAPQLSLPDDEAIQVFQQVYERPTETPQPRCVGALADATKASAATHPLTAERPAELPPATPETLAKAVEENQALAKELERQNWDNGHLARWAAATSKESRDSESAAADMSAASDPQRARCPLSQLDAATRSEQPTAAERPAASVVAAPVAADRPAAPVAFERPAELPPATPETLAKVVEENLMLAKELPQPWSCRS